MGRMGPTEWIIILIVVLLLFGGKKIPELMKGLGSGFKQFKDASKEDQPANSKQEDPSPVGEQAKQTEEKL